MGPKVLNPISAYSLQLFTMKVLKHFEFVYTYIIPNVVYMKLCKKDIEIKNNYSEQNI